MLDEPTNGLDADGTIEIRRLLQRLHRDEGITILISSHLLAEIGKLDTQVGVIARGRMVFEGTMAGLQARAQPAPSVRLETSDDVSSLAILAASGIPAHVADGRIVMPAMSAYAIATANRQLVEGGIGVHDIGVPRGDF